MKLFKHILCSSLLLMGFGSQAQQASMDGFITELLGKMTLEEKIGQLRPGYRW